MPHCGMLRNELELLDYLFSKVLSNLYDFCIGQIDFTKIFAPLRQMVVEWWPIFIDAFGRVCPE
jgi:hypothetical protein